LNSNAKQITKREDYEATQKIDSISIEDLEKITIIIPTLNEEEAISLVINDVLTNGYENIIVVDGNSIDRTVDNAKKFNVTILKQEGKGKTGAIATEIKHIKTPYFALIDGDCTYGAKDIENLIPLLANNDQVIGARTKGRENISTLNRFGNWLINQTFNTFFGTKLTDVCSGLYLLKTDFAKNINFKTEGFDVEVEIAAHAASKGTIAESPIDFFSRIGDQKLDPFSDGAKILTTIVKSAMLFHPLRVLSLTTIFLIFPGLVLLSYPFIFNFLSFELSSYFIGTLLVVLAIQGITLYTVDIRIAKTRNV
jgi:glycosyltransferase involved in cell wall biosynthesis